MLDNNTSLKIGSFTINLFDHSLVGDDGQVELMQPKFIEVLYYLAQQYPNLVSRDELIEQVWDGNNYVGEKALTNAIWHIRKKLHQDDNEYIQTVRKSGYRLLQQPQFSVPKQIVEPADKTLVTSTSSKVATYIVLASILLVIGSFFVLSSYFDEDLVAQITPITSTPGREVYPAISPDGKKIVFYWKQFNQNPDLYLKDLQQSGVAPVQLTFDSDRESRPVWAKSGEKIYYAQKSWNRDRCNIVELNVQTKIQRVLAKCDPADNAAVSISNDGNTLAYLGYDAGIEKSGIYFIYINSNDITPRRFSCFVGCEYHDRDAVFSPDDSKLAINRRSQQYEEDIHLVDINTGETKQLTKGQRDIQGMAWHPITNKLVFSSEISNKRNGFIIDMDSLALHNLNIPGFSFPSFSSQSPDVFYHNWKNEEYISSFDINAQSFSAPFPLIQSEFTHNYPMFSERAKKIAYLSNESGNREIWIADEDGTNRIQLTNLKENIFFPRWSHAGDKIAFLIRQTSSNKSTIHILDVVTKVVKKLDTDDFLRFGMPTWMQGDQAILVEAFTPERSAYYAIKLDGKSYTKLLDVKGGFAIHTKNNELWFSSSARNVSRIQLDQIEAVIEEVLPPRKLSSEYSWLKTDEAIVFQQNYVDHLRINHLDLNTGEITTKLRVPQRTVERFTPFSIISGKQRLLITQTLFPQVDIERLSHPLLED